MKVPLFDLKKQHKAIERELTRVFSNVLLPCNYILGESVLSFENAMVGYLGTKHAIGVSSGTDALLIALMAASIGPGDEVLCPAFTFFATAGVVARVGATPVWVDSNNDDFNLDPEDAARKITARTKAIIPVHLFGQSANMDAVMHLAKEHNLIVIEDVAQSLGATYKQQQLGTIGHIGCFSFYPTKNLGALGDAGMVTTNDDEFAAKLKMLRVHGMESKYYHPVVGGNFRLDAIQAAFLEAKLPYLNSYIERRRENARFYDQSLANLNGYLTLPTELRDNFHTWNQYTIRVRGGFRDDLRAFLSENWIGTEIYYPETLDVQPCFSQYTFGKESLNRAHQLSKEVLSLPIFPELTKEERDAVVEVIQSFFKQAKSKASLEASAVN
ncbi:MAG: hypothetical protein COZ46_04820 [Verrucomicrobia bacterium CG_4_10_14_3_um_filter_43_23]|nr:MAG: hypothetical protein AUJ82_08305 [Verrucomicrobia bacterium CG1_02_43_26]PIP59927.1 MAG: hypothetical protein COX01_00855 [Verrucomicrobia bacterium CG22_combo_CG10-13_8_21_14_all_43_17]PIX58267.1 MAG: hypothetical protein COZ46_04820 [Verrucomicrobia bacterium CG_4_10_14_3_um_filter_43_23]PIY62453.1 MAG: hypothetical protein COY94_02130 [Verrucomicrobia bacterium CG_4_10_14_0_8_um_filter_43_34]PJA44459.1 MAG: hypothetical protein CO175_02755 [Verrucomicrobia bacterium CG_4_9_14_3_um_fi